VSILVITKPRILASMWKRLGWVVCVAVMLALQVHAQPPKAKAASALRVTTHSRQARALYEQGFIDMLNLHSAAALEKWRAAAGKDPNFALDRMLLAHFTTDPAEQRSERNQALALEKRVSHPEQLVITWLSSADEGHFVPAIAAMNDVLALYPRDQRLAWLAGVWIENQQQYEHAIPLFERALAVDPKFAGALNEVAYCYAFTKQFDKALAAMDRYVAVLPNEPNPQDSYAEISRMAGHFDKALEHYHAALEIDPHFYESHLGLGDTYALMGDEEAARKEYAIAIQHAYTPTDGLNWSMQAAISYFREGNPRAADKALLAVAHEAHEKHLAIPEAEAYRMMALYQQRPQTALRLLAKADKALADHRTSTTARDEEQAQVLRVWTLRAAEAGDMKDAQSALHRLEGMAKRSQDGIVQLAWHSASGAVLVAQGDYEQAVADLSEDTTNPLSLRLLEIALRKSGSRAEAAQLAASLSRLNLPTIEAAVVVPQFRAVLPAHARFIPR
jgi:tetratricopeptide (TPR) repeat protein